MHQSKPSRQHTDVIHSGAFTGNLQRASLLPGEIAMRPPVSREVRAAASSGGYPQPTGVSIYRRHLTDMKWPHRDGSMSCGVERSWWHWPAITSLVILAVCGLILALAGGSGGADVSLMLHKLN